MSALRKVLVVDDDPAVSKSFDRVLSAKGYQVIMAHDAAQALEELRSSEVDMVFTDIRMPGMDGVELAEQVKARRPWTPVVIVTGYGTQDNEQRAKRAGVTAFLHKPLTPEQMEGAAREALETGLPTVAATVAPAAEAAVQAPQPVIDVAPAPAESRIKNIALFVAAPFIGLLYAMFLPFVGLGMVAWMGIEAAGQADRARRVFGTLGKIGKVIAAPFIGLAYVLLFPFVGAVALAWIGVREPTAKR